MEEILKYLDTPGRVPLRYFPHNVAVELSPLAAVLLYDVDGQLRKRKKPNLRAGRSWIYDTLGTFAAKHPYASVSGIRKAFLSLTKLGYMHIDDSGQFNPRRYDFKWWFAVEAKGKRAAQVRRIRFNPDVAAALGITKAVLLENARHHLHKEDGDGFVELDPAKLELPWTSRTTERHLAELVRDGILERDADRRHYYCRGSGVPLPEAEDQPEEATADPAPYEPYTIEPAVLLPVLKNGEIGLLAGCSGVGKTSLATFIADQHAIAGKKVLFISLEEPGSAIANRLYAHEYGVDASALHRGDSAALAHVEAAIKESSDRKRNLSQNLKVLDLSKGPKLTPTQFAARVSDCLEGGFAADLILVDQLEFIDAPAKDPASAGVAIGPAERIRECLPGVTCPVWILHQVCDATRLDFIVDDVSGGTEVTKHFDRVVGIGREGGNSNVLRLFSLTPGVQFDQRVMADFPHMRFKPIA